MDDNKKSQLTGYVAKLIDTYKLPIYVDRIAIIILSHIVDPRTKVITIRSIANALKLKQKKGIIDKDIVFKENLVRTTLVSCATLLKQFQFTNYLPPSTANANNVFFIVKVVKLMSVIGVSLDQLFQIKVEEEDATK